MVSIADAEIEAFSAFFTRPISEGGGGNEPLLPAEKAILRSYLYAALAGRL